MAKTATQQCEPAVAGDTILLADGTVHGTFCWNELNVRDVEAAKQFYQDTLGWTFEGKDMGSGIYWLASSGNKMVAGLHAMACANNPDMPSNWLPYIAVDDVDARVERATALGATLLLPACDVPDVGRIAILREPTGATVGWMTPVPKA